VEAAIQETLNKLMQGKTVIAIAHRLSTIAEMDRLIVMDQGHIIENGSHAELVRAAGSMPSCGHGSLVAFWRKTWMKRWKSNPDY